MQFIGNEVDQSALVYVVEMKVIASIRIIKHPFRIDDDLLDDPARREKPRVLYTVALDTALPRRRSRSSTCSADKC